MRRTAGPAGLHPGQQDRERQLEQIDGREIRRALDEMEGPCDEAMSQALFEQVMVRLAAQQRRHRRRGRSGSSCKRLWRPP